MKQNVLCWLLMLGLGLLPVCVPGQSAPGLVVHEWGTFTSLQDETGQAIGGINTDDEPVPPFVHRLANFLLLSPTEVPPIFFQGAPHCHPDVTMRLETPVLYFHVPAQRPFQDVNVSASFRGGWLSEFYPDAEARAPGLVSNTMVFGPLRSDMDSTLTWAHLRVGVKATGPATTAHVWTAPRAVEAADIRAVGGEAERFLFYRGVARVDAPISVVQDEKHSTVALRNQCSPEITRHGPQTIRKLWLVDISNNGSLAFRELPPLSLNGETKTLATISSHFAPADYSVNNRETLKTSLQAALVNDGLFSDEAQALLNTWELSYFKSAGMRLFFLVPRHWTDFYLPLKVSPPANVTRVMVGRIELVTPWQRNYLQQIAETSTNAIQEDAMRLHTDFYSQIGRNPNDLREVDAGKESLQRFGVQVPRSYQAYLALGRFRNALVLEEARKHPSPSLNTFIANYGLQGYKPVEVSRTER